jgi:hypothetical protein
MTTVLDQLQTISRDLDAAIRQLSEFEMKAADAESTYRVAKARAFLRAEGAVQAREHQAVLDTAVELVERDKTAAMVRVQRDYIKSLHARIDVGRTIASAEKALSGVVT